MKKIFHLLIGLTLGLTAFQISSNQAFAPTLKLKTVKLERLKLQFQIPDEWSAENSKDENNVMEQTMYKNADGTMIFTTSVFTEIPFTSLSEALDDFSRHLQGDDDKISEQKKIKVNGIEFLQQTVTGTHGHADIRMLQKNNLTLLVYGIVGDRNGKTSFEKDLSFVTKELLGSFKAY